MIDLKLLIKSGVQFGHQTWRWCPKMRPYIWGQKNDVHLIDVSKTAFQLEKAAKFLESVVASGKPVLWVGTKKAAQDVIKNAVKPIKCPYVTHRWIGGTLTNYSQVKKSITKLLHFEDILAKTEQYSYTKKEYGVFQKIVERLLKNVGGIRTLTWPVGAVVIIDVKKEHVAVKEAISAGIPIVALVDTNSDPSMIDYVIPANDDVPRAISVIVDYLAAAIARGQATSAAKPQEELVTEQSIENLLEQALGIEEDEDKPARRGSRAPGAGPVVGRAPKKVAPRFKASQRSQAPSNKVAAEETAEDVVVEDDKASE